MAQGVRRVDSSRPDFPSAKRRLCFRNREQIMDYPRYLVNGLQIGSGPVESACKTVVVNRLKGAGCVGKSLVPMPFGTRIFSKAKGA